MSNIKIEFHVLQSFPPANLNRDDTNSPKDCMFGGVRRARISSQCIKRSIRLHPDFELATGVEPAQRTRWLASDIKKSLIVSGKNEKTSSEVSSAFVDALLGGIDKKNPERSTVLFYISEEEKKSIVEGLLANWEKSLDKDFNNLTNEFQKAFSSRNSAPDIALFGRMLASNPKLNLEAACQVAHAISTHQVNMEMDFFTAVDDLLTDEELGAGMMGITGFNSATFYRYAVIDWEQLVVNLGGDMKLAKKTIAGFSLAQAKAVPTGKQNSFAAQTPPAFILAVIRQDGQAWSLANAFETQIRADKKIGGFLAPSIQALENHWQQLNTTYGSQDLPAVPIVLHLPGGTAKIDVFKEAQVDNLAAMIDAIVNALPEE